MKLDNIGKSIDSVLSGMDVSDEKIENICDQARQQPKQQPGYASKRRTVLPVMVVVLLFSLLAAALGSSPVNHTASVVDGHLEVFFEGTGVEPSEQEKQDGIEPGGLAGLYGESFAKQYADFGTYMPLPLWIPDGFYIDSMDYSESGDSFKVLQGCFTDGTDKTISVRIKRYSENADSSIIHFMDESTLETWHINGFEFAYYQNYEDHDLLWLGDRCELKIHGNIDRDTMRKIAESVAWPEFK